MGKETELYLEMISEWQNHTITQRVIQIFQALQYQTQQSYKDAQSMDQFEYLRGLEIGYARVIELMTEEIKNPVNIVSVSIPTIEKQG